MSALFPSENVARKRSFLVTRSKIHAEAADAPNASEAERLRELQIAASLNVDIAALYLIELRIGDAKQHLAKAADYYTRLEQPQGLLFRQLESVATLEDDEGRFDGPVENFLRRDDRSRGEADSDSALEVTDKEKTSVQQVFRWYLGTQIETKKYKDVTRRGGIAGRVRELILELPYRNMSFTEITIQEAITQVDHVKASAVGQLKEADSFTSRLIGLRQIKFDRMRRDHFHWSRIPIPRALIDFEAMAIFLAAGTAKETVEAFNIGDDMSLASLPIRVAAEWQQDI